MSHSELNMKRRTLKIEREKKMMVATTRAKTDPFPDVHVEHVESEVLDAGTLKDRPSEGDEVKARGTNGRESRTTNEEWHALTRPSFRASCANLAPTSTIQVWTDAARSDTVASTIATSNSKHSERIKVLATKSIDNDVKEMQERLKALLGQMAAEGLPTECIRVEIEGNQLSFETMKKEEGSIADNNPHGEDEALNESLATEVYCGNEEYKKIIYSATKETCHDFLDSITTEILTLDKLERDSKKRARGLARQARQAARQAEYNRGGPGRGGGRYQGRGRQNPGRGTGSGRGRRREDRAEGGGGGRARGTPYLNDAAWQALTLDQQQAIRDERAAYRAAQSERLA
jgi:hypothetical protein